MSLSSLLPSLLLALPLSSHSISVGVLDFTAEGAAPETGAVVAKTLWQGLASGWTFSVVGRDEMANAFSKTGAAAAGRACVRTGHAVVAGQVAGVDWVVMGRVQSRGDVLIVRAVLVETASKKTRCIVREHAPSGAELGIACRKIACLLATSIAYHEGTPLPPFYLKQYESSSASPVLAGVKSLVFPPWGQPPVKEGFAAANDVGAILAIALALMYADFATGSWRRGYAYVDPIDGEVTARYLYRGGFLGVVWDQKRADFPDTAARDRFRPDEELDASFVSGRSSIPFLLVSGWTGNIVWSALNTATHNTRIRAALRMQALQSDSGSPGSSCLKEIVPPERRPGSWYWVKSALGWSLCTAGGLLTIVGSLDYWGDRDQYGGQFLNRVVGGQALALVGVTALGSRGQIHVVGPESRMRIRADVPLDTNTTQSALRRYRRLTYGMLAVFAVGLAANLTALHCADAVHMDAPSMVVGGLWYGDLPTVGAGLLIGTARHLGAAAAFTGAFLGARYARLFLEWRDKEEHHARRPRSPGELSVGFMSSGLAIVYRF